MESNNVGPLHEDTAGGMEIGSITFALARDHVDEWCLLHEDEIGREIVFMMEQHQMIIEGASALPLAFLRKHQGRFKDKKVGVVITGKRIPAKTLAALLCRDSLTSS